MTCSAKPSKRQLFCRKILPFMFVRCSGGNYHSRWHKWCFCSAQGSPDDPSSNVEYLKTGEKYEKHLAVCHNTNGELLDQMLIGAWQKMPKGYRWF